MGSKHLVMAIIAAVWLTLAIWRQDAALVFTFVSFFLYAYMNWLEE